MCDPSTVAGISSANFRNSLAVISPAVFAYSCIGLTERAVAIDSGRKFPQVPPSCIKSSAAWSGCEDGGEVAAGVTTAPVRCSARLGAFVVNRLANAMLGTSNMRYQMAERAIIGNQRQRHKTNTTICGWPKNESFPATRGAKTRNG